MQIVLPYKNIFRILNFMYFDQDHFMLAKKGDRVKEYMFERGVSLDDLQISNNYHLEKSLHEIIFCT